MQGFVRCMQLAQRPPSAMTHFYCFETTTGLLAQRPPSAMTQFACFESALGLWAF